jgi:uncharacterized iron-regulated membrane protein
MRAATVRTWYRLHKWSSLICTALLLMACITGLPLVFANEIQAAFDPAIFPSHENSATRAFSIDALVAQTQARYPALHPYNVYFDDDSPRIYVNFAPSDDPKDSEFRQAVYDARTGKLLGAPKSGFNVVEFLLNLHSELFLGLTGDIIMGVMAMTFLVSLITGALVYGPFMRRLSFGTYRAHAAPRTRWFDLHNLLGMVVLSWAFVVGFTGVMNALSTPLFGLWRAQTLPAILAPYSGKPVPTHFVSVDSVIKTDTAVLPAMQVSSVQFPNSVYGSPQHFLVWNRGRTALTARLMTPALIDVKTGALTVAKSLPWYLRLVEISRPLHFGDYGDLPLKILWALFDLALIALLVSGLYLWLIRRRTPIEVELNRLVHGEKSGVAL